MSGEKSWVRLKGRMARSNGKGKVRMIMSSVMG